MNDHSSLFDKIRIKPAAKEASKPAEQLCEKPGCNRPGAYRAPKGRGNEGKYWNFCIDHVREYNATYNYFNGMDDSSVAAYQKDAIIGHRPTWSMGANKAGRGAAAARNGRKGDTPFEYDDPLGVFAGASGARKAPRDEAPRRMLPPRVRAALETLDVDENTDKATIKTKYKLLVKRFHPDANGGDRSYEARLQEIIKAYDSLKTAGIA